MSRSYTPKYRIEAKSNNGCGVWGTFDNEKKRRNLEEWRQSMNASFKLGGVNEHLSKSKGYVIHIHEAELINQKTGEVVEKVEAPARWVLMDPLQEISPGTFVSRCIAFPVLKTRLKRGWRAKLH